MPVTSLYEDIDIPDVDLWTYLFERKDKPWADDKGKAAALPALGQGSLSYESHPGHCTPRCMY